MKTISMLTFGLICFIPACGGRTTDMNDPMATSLDGSMETSIGGSSSSSSTFIFATGGSSVTALTITTSTGGSNAATSTTQPPATSGSSAIATTASVTGGAASTEAPLSKLTLKLATDTPSSAIVTPGEEKLLAKYLLTNPGDRDTYIASTILQVGSTTASDLATIRMTNCGTENWETKLNGCKDPATCYFRDGSYALSQNFPISEKQLHAPPRQTVPVCLYATPSEIGTPSLENTPRSGDEVSIRVGSMITNDADIVSFEKPYDPPKMVLRKAKPIISILPVDPKINEGSNEVFKFKIKADPVGEKIQWMQFSLQYKKSQGIELTNGKLFKGETEINFMGFNGSEIRTIPAGLTTGNILISHDEEVSSEEIYTLTGTISGAQEGDSISFGFERSLMTAPITGYRCSRISHGQFPILVDTVAERYGTESIPSCPSTPEDWKNQGTFLWSDMSNQETHKDWTDDFLLEGMDQTVTLNY